MLLVLADRETAEAASAELEGAGVEGLEVHREALAGDDDAEDAQWVVVVPRSALSTLPREALDALAERWDGWVEEH